MKKIFSFKYLTSVCFLALLGIMLAGSLHPAGQILRGQMESISAGEGFSTSQAEQEYNVALPHKFFYVTLNGGFQRLMGVRYINERYLMDNGHMTYVIPKTDVTPMAENTVAFRDALEEMGIPFAYVNLLFKVDPQDWQLPVSVADYTNENADQFLSILAEHGVNTLDLRKLEKEQGLDHYSLYFKADHHWTPEAGFWGYTQIVSWLESLDSRYAVDPILTQEENYNFDIYENIFCGGFARRVGPLYAGLDDMTVISPKFDTFLRVDIPSDGISRQGSYQDTILFYDNLTLKDPDKSSAYNVYLNSNYPFISISNDSRSRNLPVQSQPRKLLILKDSYVMVMAPYLALSYDEVCLVDLRAFDSNLLDFIEEYQPDMVLTMYNPGVLDLNNTSLFQFIP